MGDVERGRVCIPPDEVELAAVPLLLLLLLPTDDKLLRCGPTEPMSVRKFFLLGGSVAGTGWCWSSSLLPGSMPSARDERSPVDLAARALAGSET